MDWFNFCPNSSKRTSHTQHSLLWQVCSQEGGYTPSAIFALRYLATPTVDYLGFKTVVTSIPMFIWQ